MPVYRDRKRSCECAGGIVVIEALELSPDLRCRLTGRYTVNKRGLCNRRLRNYCAKVRCFVKERNGYWGGRRCDDAFDDRDPRRVRPLIMDSASCMRLKLNVSFLMMMPWGFRTTIVMLDFLNSWFIPTA